MLKKRVQSKSRNIDAYKTTKTNRILINDRNDKNIIKKNNLFLYKYTTSDLTLKSAISTPNNYLTTKSSNATPKIKSRKSSKQNITPHSTLFYPQQKQKCQQNLLTFEADEDYNEENIKSVKKRIDYRFLYHIGSGGFGKVWKVQDKKQNKFYAMKQMSKARIIAKKSVNSIMNQRQLLQEMRSNFIINSYCSFQDRQNLYLVMEYLKGGDLRYHMCFYQYFDEIQTKFITACIIQGLQYIHQHNIIHRDIKPQNIIFQDNGYARITDFGVARKKKANNSQETSGTPGYMSPQVICRMNHSFQSDFFALGVIVFELIFGMRPYMGDSRKQIREKILAHQACINPKDLPPGWSIQSIDFINRLLKRNKESRLGYKGVCQLKEHPWLRDINWGKLARKQIKPPFIPGVICQSREYQKEMQQSEQTMVNEQTSTLLRMPEVQNIFRKYDSKGRRQRRKPKFMNFTASSGFKKNFIR